jgi:hypothetical protein
VIILAIDPGPTESAWVIYHTTPKQILGYAKEPNAAVQEFLRNSDTSADMLAIEKVASFGMPVGEEVFETVYWSGRFAQTWNRDLRLRRITRHEVKMHVCKSPRANDSTIRQALIDRFGKPGTRKAPGGTYGLSGDVWAALAVAVTAAETEPLTRGDAFGKETEKRNERRAELTDAPFTPEASRELERIDDAEEATWTEAQGRKL